MAGVGGRPSLKVNGGESPFRVDTELTPVLPAPAPDSVPLLGIAGVVASAPIQAALGMPVDRCRA